MISVSNYFLDLMKENIRPKIEPTITVRGQDDSGKDIVLSWKPQNIQSMTYRRGIDPIGRTLPYMELTWTEIYYGKLNSNNYPEKYNNVVKYMEVELSFEQSLGFYNTWKSIRSASHTWKSVLENFKTWKNVKREVSKERIKLPTMFLVAKPTIQGQTITWVAKDLFYFLNQSHSRGFSAGIPYRNPIRWLLLDERGNFRNSNELFEAITQTQLKAIDKKDVNLDKDVVFDSTTKNLLKNYASIHNYYWDFENNYAVLKSILPLVNKSTEDVVFEFTGNILKEFPQLTDELNISAYSFKQYFAELDEANSYTLNTPEIITYKGQPFYRFLYKGLGVQKSGSVFSASDISKDTIDTNDSIEVTPVNFNNCQSTISVNNLGEIFNEDNPVNPYSANDTYIKERVNLLNNWFSSYEYAMVLNSLSNVAVEPGDLVNVETNLFYNDKRISRHGIVTDIELTYNGTLKQKTNVHGVNVFYG